jgi:hypothetical protein
MRTGGNLRIHLQIDGLIRIEDPVHHLLGLEFPVGTRDGNTLEIAHR